MEAIEKPARIAAIESSADGICWTFSPMVDICRDARWGRVSEGNGEDPFLVQPLHAMIRGYQGKGYECQQRDNGLRKALLHQAAPEKPAATTTRWI